MVSKEFLSTLALGIRIKQSEPKTLCLVFIVLQGKGNLENKKHPIGKGEDKALQKQINKESEKHGDIIQGDFLDTYHNLSFKEVMGNLWVSEFCEQAEFVVKTDDDQFVDLYEVYILTRTYLNSSHYATNRYCKPLAI